MVTNTIVTTVNKWVTVEFPSYCSDLMEMTFDLWCEQSGTGLALMNARVFLLVSHKIWDK